MGEENKTPYIDEDYHEAWVKFCVANFKTKKVLSKIITEAMELYMVNFERIN